MTSKLIYLAVLFATAFTYPAQAQQPVPARIVDRETGSGVSGATIKYRGRTFTSDETGSFPLRFPDKEKSVDLLVSAMGYARVDTTLSPSVSSITIPLLPLAAMLDEVVVSTGYQQLPRERATGSFAFLSNERLNEQVGPDILGRLEAVANSVQVDRNSLLGSERIMVRGLSTIQGSTAPLIVLDNFPYEGDFANINPNDVESITILKDAAAASIWGAKAGNGVIIITTKKGLPRQPLRIEFNSNVTVGDRPDPFRLHRISSSDFIDVESMLYRAGYFTGQLNDRNKPALSPVVELLVQRETASPDEIRAIDAELARLRGVDVRKDFERHVYQRSVNQQYFLGLRGGSDLMGWNLSVGHDRNSDNLESGYDRFNARAQHTMKPLRNTTINSGIIFTQSRTSGGRPGYGQLTSMNGGLYPYAELADGEGNSLPIVRNIRRHYLDNEADSRLLDWKYYPLDDYRHLRNSSVTNSVLLNTALNHDLPIGLGLGINYQYERQQRSGRDLQGAESFAARDMVNRYTRIGPDGRPVYPVPPGGILDLSDNLTQSHNVRAQLNYAGDWGHHEVNAIMGGELRHVGAGGHGNRLYGYDDGILAYAHVDPTRQYPHHISGANLFIPTGLSVSRTTNRYVSTYANASYSFKRRYVFSLSGRRDASNLFGLSINDKWNPLWSTGMSWEISREHFYGSGWAPFLKMRLTYGHSGNVNPDMVALTTISYAPNPNQITQAPYASFSNFANPELTWETVGTFNAGIDFAIATGRLKGSLEFYSKDAGDLYGPAPMDYTAGVGYTITKNVAGMRARGMDAELEALHIDGIFKWRSHLNLSLNRERVTGYYLPDRRGSRFVGYTNQISGIVGNPVRSVFSYPWAGLDPDTGEALGYIGAETSKDYRELTGTAVLLDDLVFHGSTLPTAFGSLGNTFSYRNFRVTARISYKFGYYFRRETIRYSNLFGNLNGHGDFNQRWRKPGDEAATDIPAMIYPIPFQSESFYPFAEPFVERGDHIRLQYLDLRYGFTKAVLPSIPFNRMDLYVNVSNLGLLWKSTKAPIDPDFATATSTSMPTPIACAFGIRLDL